jgi:hypothetical protein
LSELPQHDYDAPARVRALRAVLCPAAGPSTTGEAQVATPQQEKENMKKVITLMVIALLCAVANAAPGNSLAHYKADALIAVKKSLKDPDSARGLRLAPIPPAVADNKVVVFVIVNAKNGFGGYTGDTLFFALFEPGRPVFVDKWRGLH